MKNKKIPIKAAKDIANEYGYNQIIIHGYDIESGVQSVCTYGKSQEDCDNAAKGGNAIKKLLGWPDDLCNTKPQRVKKRIKNINKIIDESDLIYILKKLINDDTESLLLIEDLKIRIKDEL